MSRRYYFLEKERREIDLSTFHITMTTLHPALFKFLDAIKQENSRKYFASIKPLYDDIRVNLQEFVKDIIKELSKEDRRFQTIDAKSSLFRIYRDARRLKDWDLIYKQNRWAHITPYGKNTHQAWYYLHLESGKSFLWWWIYRPDSKQLQQIRNFLIENGQEYYTITNKKKFKSTFGNVQGDSLSKLPRWFNKDTVYPELIIKKQYLIYHHYTDEEVLSSWFLKQLLEDCKTGKPFFDFLNKSFLDN